MEHLTHVLTDIWALYTAVVVAAIVAWNTYISDWPAWKVWTAAAVAAVAVLTVLFLLMLL